MTKNILQEYFAAFRWGRIKECYKGNNCWFFIYSISILPFSLVGNFSRSPENVAAYFLLMVPLLFHLFVLPLQPVRLPKIMCLCPMAEEERRNYLKRTLEIKTGISILIELLAFAVLVSLGRYSSFLLLLAFALSIMIILATVMQERTVGSTGTLTTAWEWWEAGALIVYILEYWVLISRIFWAEPCSSVEKILYPAVLLVVDLPLLLKVLSFWKEKLKIRINYETANGQETVKNRKTTGKG